MAASTPTTAFALIAVTALFFGATTTAAVDLPTFPKDWSATQTQTLQINQGGVVMNGMTCCAATANCKVQNEYAGGTQYFDFTNQRTRFNNIVNLYGSVKKEIQVDSSNTCQAYCPLEDDKLEVFGIDPNATDLGATTIDGKAVEHWQWKEKIFHLITMQTTDFYVDQSSSSGAIPVFQIDDLTPFGQHLGQSNTSWANFKAGTPDASLFDVKGLDSCKQSPNCGQNQLQQARLMGRNFKTWAKYYQQK